MGAVDMNNSTKQSIYLLSNSDNIEVDRYYFRQWNGYSMIPHSHFATEIMYVITGTAPLIVDGQKVLLCSGDLILIDSLVDHGICMQANETCRMLNVEFMVQPANMPQINVIYNNIPLLNQFLTTPKPYVVVHDAHEVYAAFQDLILELEQHRADNIYGIILWNILAKIARLYQISTSSGNYSSIYVEKAIRYIYENYDKAIKISDIASLISINESYLQRLFKLSAGTTITAFLLDVRMAKAKSLIKDTDIKIDEINQFVGISSKPYFYSCFRKKYGMTPLEYRKENECFQ